MAFFSTSSSDYASEINKLTKPTYTSKYDSTIESIMNDIANREEFSYDFNADPLYQNYKDQYTKLGNEAAMNASAAVSTQTGGFGNSYAATAASQANQQYLTQLNEKIPELAEAALDKYQMETENLYNKFNMYETEENRQYGQYRDNVSDYYSDYSNLLSGYSTALSQENADRDYNYQVSRDAVEDAQWQKEYDTSVQQWNRQYDADTSQWEAEFNESKNEWQQEFDESKAEWQKEYELAAKKAASGGSGGSTSNNNSDDLDYNRTSVTTSTSELQGLLSQLNSYADTKAGTKAKLTTRNSYKDEMLESMYNNGELSYGDLAYLWDALGIVKD